MNSYVVSKSTLSGEIKIPPSKSQTMRAILFGLLGKGKTVVQHYLDSPDTHAMLQACRSLGANLHVTPEMIEISSGAFKNPSETIHAGNSGIVLRFISAIAALKDHPVTITGDYSIRNNRPMQPLLSGLSQLGVKATSALGNGFAPVTIQGPLTAGKAMIEGADSQPVSALLIAATQAKGPIELKVLNPGEKPWVAMTLSWFDRLNIPYQNFSFENYRIPGNSPFTGFEYAVPGDLSSAAFPIAAALITKSALSLKNVDMEDCQGDKQFISLMQTLGGNIQYDHQTKILHVKKMDQPLKGCDVDINDYIDSIAILAVIACFTEGPTIIRNAAIARTKECDRIHCLAKELRKIGADIDELEDGLKIRPALLKGAEVFSHHDHRLAMALTIAGFGAEGETKIDSISCINKTFPNFFEHFQSLGAHLRQI